jgi:hypothetical protein
MNQWVHYAVVRSGSTFTMYRNGEAVSTGTYAGAITASTITPLEYISAGSAGISGYLSNFRIVNGTAVYTSNFLPSSLPLTVIANTKLLTCQSSSSASTDASGTFTVTPNNSAAAGTTSPFNSSAGIITI